MQVFVDPQLTMQPAKRALEALAKKTLLECLSVDRNFREKPGGWFGSQTLNTRLGGPGQSRGAAMPVGGLFEGIPDP